MGITSCKAAGITFSNNEDDMCFSIKGFLDKDCLVHSVVKK